MPYKELILRERFSKSNGLIQQNQMYDNVLIGHIRFMQIIFSNIILNFIIKMNL